MSFAAKWSRRSRAWTLEEAGRILVFFGLIMVAPPNLRILKPSSRAPLKRDPTRPGASWRSSYASVSACFASAERGVPRWRSTAATAAAASAAPASNPTLSTKRTGRCGDSSSEAHRATRERVLSNSQASAATTRTLPPRLREARRAARERRSASAMATTRYRHSERNSLKNRSTRRSSTAREDRHRARTATEVSSPSMTTISVSEILSSSLRARVHT
mmetsp:Transcript_20441/g.64265  ORF Transcript_20441/g.64265 Transcript_20441/m.64265 type:complete len:218 (+) Transcript_20441:448-1101(+)